MQRTRIMKNRHRQKLCHDERGITLIELLVSMTVFAIIALPLLSAFVSGARINARTREKLTGTLAASEIIEEMKGAGVNEFMKEMARYRISEPADGNDHDTFYMEWPINNNDYIGDRKVSSVMTLINIYEVSEHTAAGDSRLYRVTVSVYPRNTGFGNIDTAKKIALLTGEIAQ